MGIKFEINNYYELLSLHKTIIEAKFHPDPENIYISASPHIAKIANMIVDCIKNYHQKRNEIKKIEEWARFIEGKIDDWVWKRIFSYAIEDKEWDKINEEEKKEYVLNLMSPFKYTNEMVKFFIKDVEEKRKLHNKTN